MSVKYILSQAGNKIGLNPANSDMRSVLLRFLNEAARELYNQSDMPGSQDEGVYKVNGDQTISLPVGIGVVRAVRELDSQLSWHLNQPRPRFNQFNWIDSWRNIRLLYIRATQYTVVNQSVGVFTVSAVENPPITVSVTGPTDTANLASESVVMDALVKQTVNQFKDYKSVTKDRVNNFDVSLTDIDGNVITVIPNNMVEAKYQVIDVSSCPWLQISQSTLDHYLEVLYKKTLPILSLDTDEFPAVGYDDILVNKMLQLWFEEQGKSDIAVAYDAKATRTLARETEEQNRATEDVVALVANGHDVLMPRIRGQGRRRRFYRGYGSRGGGYQ